MNKTPKCTAKQADMLRRIRNSPFIKENGGWQNPSADTWSVDVVSSRSDAAVLGSLMKKGLIKGNGQGTSEATVRLTDAGREWTAADVAAMKVAAQKVARAEGAAEYREAYEAASPAERRQMDAVDAIDRAELDECTGCGLTEADGVEIDETGRCNECRHDAEEKLAAIETAVPSGAGAVAVLAALAELEAEEKLFTCVETERAPEPFIQVESYGCELGPVVGPEAVCQHCLVAVSDHWRVPMAAVENLHRGGADGGLACGAPSAYALKTWNPDAVTCKNCRAVAAQKAAKANPLPCGHSADNRRFISGTNTTWCDACTIAAEAEAYAEEQADERARLQEAEEEMPFGADAAAHRLTIHAKGLQKGYTACLVGITHKNPVAGPKVQPTCPACAEAAVAAEQAEHRAERRREEAAKLEQGIRDSLARRSFPEGEQQAPVAAHDEHACGVCFGEVTDGGAGHAEGCPCFELPLGASASSALGQAALSLAALKAENARAAAELEASNNRRELSAMGDALADAEEAASAAVATAKSQGRLDLAERLASIVESMNEISAEVQAEGEQAEEEVAPKVQFTTNAYQRAHGGVPRESANVIGQWAFRKVNSFAARDEDAAGPIFFTAPMTYAKALEYVRKTQAPGLYAILP